MTRQTRGSEELGGWGGGGSWRTHETFLTPSRLHDCRPLLWMKGARRGGERGVLAETCFADTKCLSVLLGTEVPIKLGEKVV